jgi:serine protease Do
MRCLACQRTASFSPRSFSQPRWWHSSCFFQLRDSNAIRISEYAEKDGRSLALITAGPIRQRAATADASHGYCLRLAHGVGAPTSPPLMPAFVQDDGRLPRFGGLFIVFRLRLAVMVIDRAANARFEQRESKMSLMGVSRRWAVALAILVVTAGAAQAQSKASVGAADELSRSTEAVARLVSPAVVQIFTTSYLPAAGVVPRAADLVTTQRASGSGVIVDPEGYIVTNAHVVSAAQRVSVDIRLPVAGESILSARSRTVNATTIGIDLETDLAVIKVDEPNLATVPFGDSDALRAGQLVLAFGSPLGLDNSVSLGIVSAVARQLEPESPMIYVQTDTAMNPGNSGGPLVDLRGRIVGINTLILSQDGGSEGLGFSAPSNIVRRVYEQIRQFGRVRRGDIGVRAQTVTPTLAQGLALPRERGVVLADVIPGSPADRAGLRIGDMVLSLDGKPMENGRQLQVDLYRHVVGDVVTLEILRDLRADRFQVAVAERRDLSGLSNAVDAREHAVARLGILGLALTDEIRQMLPALRVRTGVVVASTVAGATDSRDGGFAPGDVIYAINRVPVSGLDELRTVVDKLRIGDPVVVQLQRRGELMYLAFTLE